MTQISCERCGKKKMVFPSYIKRGGGRFCSVACARKREPRICIVCSHPTARRDRPYCSKECAVVARKLEVVSRFFSMVNEKRGGCWLWTGAKDRAGYGRFSVSGVSFQAHRWSLEYHVGRPDTPDDLCLHSCHTPACVNPDHLRWGSHADNSRDMTAAGREASTLTRRQMDQIIQRFFEGETQRELAEAYGVSRPTVCKILTGRTHRSVTGRRESLRDRIKMTEARARGYDSEK